MEELAETLADEQRGIVGMDPGQLTASSCRKEKVTADLQRLQGECGELIERLGRGLGVANSCNLSAVIAATGEEELRRLQQRQLRLAKGVERQIALNRKMLVNSIALIENSMDQFGRVLGGCATYGAQGKVKSSAATGSILRREI